MAIEGLGRAMTEIAADYDQWRPPFSEQGGITDPVVRDIHGKRNKALFLTLSTALNRQRDAKALYTKFARLWGEEHWIFEPAEVVEERPFEELADLFEDEGVRFGRTDAEVWYEISRTLYHDYNSNPMTLFRQFDFDFERISSHVRDASGETRFHDHGKKFPVLRGEKIRPMWLRLIDGYVHPLGSQEGAEVSVDTHIIQITNRLFDREYTNDPQDKAEIRGIWREVCQNQPIDPVDIDGPLWYINRGWSGWGREYLTRKLEGELPVEIEHRNSTGTDEDGAEGTTTGHTRSGQKAMKVDIEEGHYEIFTPHEDVMKRTAMKIGSARYFVDTVDFDLEIEMTDAPYHLCDGDTLAISPEELDHSSWTKWTIHQFRLIIAAAAMEPNGWRVLTPSNTDTEQYVELEAEYFPPLVEARDVFGAAGDGINQELRRAGHHPDQFIGPE